MEVVLLHFPISALAWFTNVFIDVSSGPWQHTRVPLVFVLDAPSPNSVTCMAGLDLFSSCHVTVNILCISSDVCTLSDVFSCLVMLYHTVVLCKSPDRCSQVSYIRVRRTYVRTKESERGYHAVHRKMPNIF